MKLPIHSLVRIGTLAMLVAPGHASASDYGCKVLLCLANPASNGGPKGVAECVDPINRLYNDLAYGRPFPRCEEAEATGNRAVPVNDPFDPCPSPLQPAEPDQYVVQGRPSASSVFGYSQTAAPQLGATAGQRACVGRFVGRYQMGGNDDGTTVNVYDQVVWQKAQSPRAIDLYLDNVWQQRVHWQVAFNTPVGEFMQKKQEDRPAVDSDQRRQATEDATCKRRCLWGRKSVERVPARRSEDVDAGVTDDDLLSDWKAERTAFGLLLVGYAFLMSMAPLLARYPNETVQMACTSIRHIVDWRVWVLSASAMCLAAIAAIVLKRRRQTVSTA